MKKVNEAVVPFACRRRRAGHFRRKHLPSKPERGIGNAVEIEQPGIGWKTGGGDQSTCFVLAEIEFDDGAGEIPRRVLATNQVVSLVMIERVGLDQAAAGRPKPFVPVELVVGANAADA